MPKSFFEGVGRWFGVGEERPRQIEAGKPQTELERQDKILLEFEEQEANRSMENSYPNPQAWYVSGGQRNKRRIETVRKDTIDYPGRADDVRELSSTLDGGYDVAMSLAFLDRIAIYQNYFHILYDGKLSPEFVERVERLNPSTFFTRENPQHMVMDRMYRTLRGLLAQGDIELAANTIVAAETIYDGVIADLRRDLEALNTAIDNPVEREILTEIRGGAHPYAGRAQDIAALEKLEEARKKREAKGKDDPIEDAMHRLRLLYTLSFRQDAEYIRRRTHRIADSHTRESVMAHLGMWLGASAKEDNGRMRDLAALARTIRACLDSDPTGILYEIQVWRKRRLNNQEAGRGGLAIATPDAPAGAMTHSEAQDDPEAGRGGMSIEKEDN